LATLGCRWSAETEREGGNGHKWNSQELRCEEPWKSLKHDFPRKKRESRSRQEKEGGNYLMDRGAHLSGETRPEIETGFSTDRRGAAGTESLVGNKNFVVDKEKGLLFGGGGKETGQHDRGRFTGGTARKPLFGRRRLSSRGARRRRQTREGPPCRRGRDRQHEQTGPQDVDRPWENRVHVGQRGESSVTWIVGTQRWVRRGRGRKRGDSPRQGNRNKSRGVFISVPRRHEPTVDFCSSELRRNTLPWRRDEKKTSPPVRKHRKVKAGHPRAGNRVEGDRNLLLPKLRNACFRDQRDQKGDGHEGNQRPRGERQKLGRVLSGKA